VDIPLSYGFDPLEKKMSLQKFDTLQNRMFFEKSKIIPRDSVINDIVQWISSNNSRVQHIKIMGFASIEGSRNGNIDLYEKRVAFLLNELQSFGLDSTKIEIQTSENFGDFRRDIQGSKFEYLTSLSDSTLKAEVQNQSLSAELEYLLKNHRYVDLKIIVEHDYEVEYNRFSVNEQLQVALKKGEMAKCSELQQI
jgi:hypothetical protein